MSWNHSFPIGPVFIKWFRGPASKRRFDTEKLMFGVLKELGLPVPELLATLSLGPVIVAQRLKGTAIDKSSDFHSCGVQQFINSIEVVSMNAIVSNTRALGWIHKASTSNYMMDVLAEDIVRIVRLRADGELTKTASAVLQTFQHIECEYNDRIICLTDYSPKNFLSFDKVWYLVDFEGAMIAEPDVFYAKTAFNCVRDFSNAEVAMACAETILKHTKNVNLVHATLGWALIRSQAFEGLPAIQLRSTSAALGCLVKGCDPYEVLRELNYV